MDREQEEVVLRLTTRYIEEVEAGHQPKISDYLARYPQYADAIANFIAYYQSVESPLSQLAGSPGSVESGESFADEFPIAIESAWQRVLLPEATPEPVDAEEITLIPEVRTIEKAGEPEAVVYGQTIQSLFVAAKQQQCSPSQLAAYLNISEDIVMLLEQRALLPESIPQEMYRRIAKTLQQPLHAVQVYLGRERRQRVAEQPPGYDFGNPAGSSAKGSFREAVDKSVELSAEQKSSWRAVLTKEGL